jgi:hypothetical protein
MTEMKTESIRHQMQIARRKNITKVKPSGKVYDRHKIKNYD